MTAGIRDLPSSMEESVKTRGVAGKKLVRPLIEAAGWDASPHCYNEQIGLTHGRIIVAGNKVKRRPQKRADFLLRYSPDFTVAVVEATKVSVPAANQPDADPFDLLCHLAYNATLRTRRERADCMRRGKERFL